MAISALRLLDIREAITSHYSDIDTVWLFEQPFNLLHLEYQPQPGGKNPTVNLDVTLKYEGVTPTDTMARGTAYLKQAFTCSHPCLQVLARSTLGLEAIGIGKGRVIFYYPDRYYARTGLKRPETTLRHDHVFVVVPTKRPFIAVFASDDETQARVVENASGRTSVIDLPYSTGMWSYVHRFHNCYGRPQTT